MQPSTPHTPAPAIRPGLDPEAVAAQLAAIRARLVNDSDAVADVDLLYGTYCLLTGEEIPHPWDDDPRGPGDGLGA